MPLGASWSGVCSLAVPEEIPERDLREMCNLGYARGRCARFPLADQADAHRFSVGSRDGGEVSVIYVIEKAHAPIAHGMLRLSEGACVEEAPNPQIESQARAFACGAG